MADLGAIGRQYTEVVLMVTSAVKGPNQRAYAYANNGGPATGTGIRLGSHVYSTALGIYLLDNRGYSQQIDALTQVNGVNSNVPVQFLFKGSPVLEVMSKPEVLVGCLTPADYEVLVYGNGSKRSETWTKTVSQSVRLVLSGTLAACSSGVAYSSGLTATGGHSTRTWAYTGALPSGLSFSTSTGLITGTTTATGSYKLTISVTVADNYRVFKDVVLTVS